MRRSRVKPVITAAAIVALLATAGVAIAVGARVIESVSAEAESVTLLNELPEVPDGIQGVGEWLPDEWARERTMEPATRVAIESAYIRAWKSLSVYQTTGSTNVVTDSFSGPLRDSVLNIPPDLLTSTVGIRHNLQLTFYALDGATVAFRDIGARFVRTTLGSSSPLVVLSEESFDVVMVLEDGYWRVRQLLRVQSEAPVIISTDQAGIVQIAGGATFASTRVGPYSATNYRIDATVNSAERLADFTLMKSLGFSTVRLSVDETSLPIDSASTVVPELWVDVLNDVSRAGLTAIAVVSLAPPSSPDDWPREYVVATRVITAIADHDALVMWDLAHEPDRDLSSNQVSQAIGFIYELREFIDSRNSRTPVTVTWNSIQHAADPTLTSLVDVVSLHLNDGDDPASALRELNPGIQDIAFVIDTVNSKPGWSPALASETRQAAVASSRLLDLESVSVVRWTMGQLRDEPGDSRGLVDSAGNVREVGALFAADNDVVLDAPPLWLDAFRSPFWLTTFALLAVTVACVVVLGLGRARRRARNRVALPRR